MVVVAVVLLSDGSSSSICTLMDVVVVSEVLLSDGYNNGIYVYDGCGCSSSSCTIQWLGS